MKHIFKRSLSLLLVLLLTGSMLPVAYAQVDSTSEAHPAVFTDEDYAPIDELFSQIDAMEDAPAKRNASESQLSDAAELLVLESDNYVDGSLERNGNTFTWWTDEGIRCIYDPRMRDIRENMTAPEEPIADGAYNEPVATKGGWPNNNEVYLIGPYYGLDSNFTDQYKKEAAAVAQAIGDSDGYTLYSGSAATIDKVADAVSNGAVVFFDSHGSTDYTNPYDEYDFVTGANYSYLCLSNQSGLTDEDYDDGALYDGYDAYVNGAAITNHMTSDSPAGIVWMAICLGMATDTLCEPLRERGVDVVYGYSQSVTFDGDYLWEEVFWDNMCAGATVAEAISGMKAAYGNWDWSTQIAGYYGYSDGYTTISAARADYSAFPIVVSDEDTHPGQRKGSNYGACSLQTVNSTYTLFPQYNIIAQSNNDSYGTVSISGNTITAVPATGYFAQGYTLLTGSAAVTQNGNSFTVRADSDCTIQISFAPKAAVTVSFSGASVSNREGYAGDAMALPTVTAPEGYTFLGWMTTPMNADSTEKPEFYTDSFTPTGSMTLYALYSYVDEDSGTGTGDYVKVTSTPADWSGEYVIVYEGSNYIFDGSLTTMDAVSNYKAVTITNNTISADQADAYKFTIEAYSTGYSIQGIGGKYIGHGSNANGLTGSNAAMVNTISLDASGNANIVGSGGAYLRFNNTSGQYRFRYYKSGSYTNQQPIALYLKDGSAGTTYYTGNPMQCEHTNTTQVAAVAATCTQSGYTAGVQCVDCGGYISGREVIEAPGHSRSDWTQTTAPTCEAAGEQTHTCSVCGERETQSIPAIGHSYHGLVTDPTETEQGYTTYTCTVCGDSYISDYIDALGKTYSVSFRVPAGVASVAAMQCGKHGIILPSAGVPTGDYAYSFAGWSVEAVNNSETIPALLKAGDTYTASGDITLNAVYSYTVGGTGESGYVLTDISEITAADVFVITMEYTDGTVYALANDAVSKAPAAVTVTVSGDKLSAEPAANLLWNIGGGTDAYIFYPDGTTARWLASTSTNNGMSVGTGSNKTYKIDSAYLYNNGTSRYVGVYRTNPDWRCYTSIHDNIKNETLGFYVKTESGTTYYTTVFETMSAALYENGQQTGLYATVEEAYAACTEGQYVQLLDSVQTDLTLTKDLYIDLNGFVLTGIINAGEYTVYGMDSATNEYTAGSGYLACTGVDGAVSTHFKTDAPMTGDIRSYMAIAGGNGWSFHRYYLGITHISLKTATTGIGYKAVFYGNDQVLAQLDADKAFGYTLSLEGGNTVSRYLTAEKVTSGKAVTLLVNNYDVESYGETKLTAYVTANLGGQEIKSASHDTTMRQVVEDINDNYTTYTDVQLTAVKELIAANAVMQTWSISNLFSTDTQEPADPMAEIVQAAYALEVGASMSEASTLTGTITGIDTAYSSQYQNISVVMTVSGAEDLPILCYRLKGNGVDQIGVGDTITVTGILMNYNGTIEFTSGCTLDTWENTGTDPEVLTDPVKIVEAAYALTPGDTLPYEVTLTGTITEIETVYSSDYQNISVVITVEGAEDLPILCYRLKGDGTDKIAVGDTVTVTGTLTNYRHSSGDTEVEFTSGCVLTGWIDNTAE